MHQAGPYVLADHQGNTGTNLRVGVAVEAKNVIQVLLEIWNVKKNK